MGGLDKSQIITMIYSNKEHNNISHHFFREPKLKN